MKTLLPIALLTFTFQSSASDIVSIDEIVRYEEQVDTLFGEGIVRGANSTSDNTAAWLQPENRTENCLVYAYSIKTVVAYWDGRCDGGYAAGLGRIIQQDEDYSYGPQDHYNYTLQEYGQPGEIPKAYLRGGNSGVYMMGGIQSRTLLIKSKPYDQPIHVAYGRMGNYGMMIGGSYRDGDPGYSYVAGNPNALSRRITYFPASQPDDVVLKSATYKNGKKHGYEYLQSYDDRTAVLLRFEEGVPVAGPYPAPKEYRQKLLSDINRFDAASQNALMNVVLAMDKLKEYQDRFCAENDHPDAVGGIALKQICMGEEKVAGDLSLLVAAMAKREQLFLFLQRSEERSE